jgi:hypothetical protein
MIDPAVEEQKSYQVSLQGRLQEFLKICGEHDPIALLARMEGRRLRYLEGWGPEMDSGIHKSSKIEEVVQCEDLADEGIGHAVYTDIDTVQKVLQDLKASDLGISIVVSGIFDEVFEACKNAGLEPHTVNMSLGTWGKTELLPFQPILELCTMCGHTMISSKLAELMIEKVKKGLISSQEAAI